MTRPILLKLTSQGVESPGFLLSFMRKGMIFDIVFILGSIALLILQIARIREIYLQLLLTILVSTFFSGYSLLNLASATQYFSKLELLSLSCLTGISLSGFAYLMLLPLDRFSRPEAMSLLYIALGVLSVILRITRRKQTEFRRSLSRHHDLIILALSLVFYIAFFLLMYPKAALIGNSDAMRSYAYSRVLERATDMYDSRYVLFHSFEANIIGLSQPNPILLQIFLAPLNLLLPILFYVVAKAYLDSADIRLPGLALVLWVFFSGLGWVFFATAFVNNIPSNNEELFELFLLSQDKTYGDTASFLTEFQWYIPRTLALALFFACLLLLSRKELPRATFVFLFSLMFASMYLVHIVEAVILAFFLSILSTFFENKQLRLDDALYSSLLGFMMVGLIYGILAMTTNFSFSLAQILALILPSTALCFSLFLKGRSYLINLGLDKLVKKYRIHLLKTACVALPSLYLVALFTWFLVVPQFSSSLVNEWNSFGLVPWFIYPTLLGVNGFLALISLSYLVKYQESASYLSFFVVMMFFLFLFARIVSYVNVNFTFLGYFERRLVPFISLGATMLASIPLLEFCDLSGIHRMKCLSSNRIVRIAIVGLVFISGVSSSFLKLGYWNIVVTKGGEGQPSSAELEALMYLDRIFDNDSKSGIITFSRDSTHAIAFSGSLFAINAAENPLFLTRSPEMFVDLLYWQPYLVHSYVYVHNRDISLLPQDSYVGLLIQILPIVFTNEEVTIYKLSALAPPLPSSDSILVIPFNRSMSSEGISRIFAYQVMSQGFYNYTVARGPSPIYEPKLKQISSADSSFGWNAKGTNVVVSADSSDKIEGSASIEVTLSNSPTFSGVKLDFPEAQDFSESIAFSVSVKVDTIANLRNPLIVFESGLEGYFQISLGNPQENTWTLYNFQKADVVRARGSPDWGKITAVRFEVDLTTDSTLNFWLDDFATTFISENITAYIWDNRFLNASNLILSSDPDKAEAEQYLPYLEKGGRIIVLNTNGFKAFSAFFFSAENKTIFVDHIKNSRMKLQFPGKIQVPKLGVRDQVEVLGEYSSPDGEEAPYSLRIRIGEGELVYINLYPIIQNLEFVENKRRFYSIFGSLIEFADINLPEFGSKNTYIEVRFDEVILEGSIDISTDSILFPPYLGVEGVKVLLGNGSTMSFTDVSSIFMGNYRSADIKTTKMQIAEGEGFYVRLKANDIEINFWENGTLALVSRDKKISVNDVKSVLISSANPLEILVRTPFIQATNSDGFFKEFLSFQPVYHRILSYSPLLRARGHVSFDVSLADQYIVTTTFSSGNSSEAIRPSVLYDEFSMLPVSVLLGISLTFGFIMGRLFGSHAYSSDPRRKQSTNE